MLKRILSITVVMCLLLSLVWSSNAEAPDYSFLDNMSIDELTALKTEIEKRINAQARSNASSSDFGMWEIKNYVDEFQNPTDQQYIRNKTLISGTFSNSVANNRELNARFLIDESGVALLLYEYGDNLVKNSYSKSREYTIIMQNSEGKKSYLRGTIYSGGDRICFTRRGSDEIIYTFRHDTNVSFYVADNENKTTTYLLKIDNTSYFSNVFNAYFGADAQPALDAKQEVFPAVYDLTKASQCSTKVPEDMLTWDLPEFKVHKGDPYFFSGIIVASLNDDSFDIDIGGQTIRVDFTEAYEKQMQNYLILPKVGDQVSVYCSFLDVIYEFDYHSNIARFTLGI